MKTFHEVPWEDRLQVAMQISDHRMRRIGQRLIYFERPEVLPEKTRTALDREIQARLNAHEDVLPWRAVADARKELDELLAEDVDGRSAGLVQEVERFLDERASALVDHTRIKLGR